MLYRVINASEQAELNAFTDKGLALLGARADAPDLLERVDDFVLSIQEARLKSPAAAINADEVIDLAWSIGSVVGEAFVKHLGWAWALVGADETCRFGVVSPNAELALYPSFFVRECVEDPARDFTALLIFNMVAAGRFEDIAAGTCLDLAEHVVRIVQR